MAAPAWAQDEHWRIFSIARADASAGACRRDAPGRLRVTELVPHADAETAIRRVALRGDRVLVESRRRANGAHVDTQVFDLAAHTKLAIAAAMNGTRSLYLTVVNGSSVRVSLAF
ncbi:MAG: hypothetical protein PGN13_09050 [Patulibacter minatonensis]